MRANLRSAAMRSYEEQVAPQGPRSRTIAKAGMLAGFLFMAVISCFCQPRLGSEKSGLRLLAESWMAYGGGDPDDEAADRSTRHITNAPGSASPSTQETVRNSAATDNNHGRPSHPTTIPERPAPPRSLRPPLEQFRNAFIFAASGSRQSDFNVAQSGAKNSSYQREIFGKTTASFVP